jgi:hypothetical protein
MLSGNVFYHGVIRKTIVAFGRLFSNIFIDRKSGDSVTGETVQRLQVPLAYSPKEKWIVRIDSDPNLENYTYTSLPRMAFEITGYTYDTSRKLAKLNKITCGVSDNERSYTYAPVPYNVDISLYILTKTQEDALQIIEQILPTFNPDYTMSINAVPDMNIVQDVPVILNNISVVDEYDGDFQTRRFVTHTLNFTLKINLFNPVNSNGIIKTVIANLTDPNREFTATQATPTSNITEDWSDFL